MVSYAALFIGLRYARASKSNHFIAFVNFFSVAGISLGLAALIVVSSVMNGFENQLKVKILGIVPHLLVDGSQAQVQQVLANTPHIKQVEHLTTMIESEGVVQTSKGLKGVLFQGVEPEQSLGYSTIENHIIQGKFTDIQKGAYLVAIGRQLAYELDVGVGDNIRLFSASASTFTPVGRLPSQRIFKVAAIFDVGSSLDNKVVLTHHSDLAKLMRKPAQKIQQTRVSLHDAFAYLPIKQYLQQQGLIVMDWRDRQGPLFDAVQMEKNMMKLMLALIIAVAAFNIVSALVMVATEKKGDMAILQTQGLESSDLLVIFLCNGLYNGIKGTFIGLTLGVLLTSFLSPLLTVLGVPIMAITGGAGLPILTNWWQVAMMATACLFVCFMASIYPALYAAKTRPANVLRYE